MHTQLESNRFPHAAGHGATLRHAARGLLALALLAFVSRTAGALATIVLLYLGGLALVLRAMLPVPPQRTDLSIPSNE